MTAALLVNWAAAGLIVVGVLFLAAGTLGLVRLPDLYTRAHAASKCDSVGAGSVLLGVALRDGLGIGDLTLVVLVALVLVSGPTCAHALARARLRHPSDDPPPAPEGGRRS